MKIWKICGNFWKIVISSDELSSNIWNCANNDRYCQHQFVLFKVLMLIDFWRREIARTAQKVCDCVKNIWRWSSHYFWSNSTFCVFNFGPLVAKPRIRSDWNLYTCTKFQVNSPNGYKTCYANGQQWQTTRDYISISAASRVHIWNSDTCFKRPYLKCRHLIQESIFEIQTPASRVHIWNSDTCYRNTTRLLKNSFSTSYTTNITIF
jgi:hypothetical protein